jgi:hypothetical protein
MPSNLVGPAKITVLLLELRDALSVDRRGPLARVRVDLGAPHPAAQRLGSDAELAGHPGDHPVALTGPAANLPTIRTARSREYHRTCLGTSAPDERLDSTQ